MNIIAPRAKYQIVCDVEYIYPDLIIYGVSCIKAIELSSVLLLSISIPPLYTINVHVDKYVRFNVGTILYKVLLKSLHICCHNVYGLIGLRSLEKKNVGNIFQLMLHLRIHT